MEGRKIMAAPGERATYDVYEQARRILSQTAPHEGGPSACCSSAEQETCCEPEAKSSCCGATASSGGCGCR